MTKKDMKEMAKHILAVSVGCAYYRLENENISEEDKIEISNYINKYGESMCKAIRKEYITY